MSSQEEDKFRISRTSSSSSSKSSVSDDHPDELGLNRKQRDALEKFRVAVDSIIKEEHDDLYLLRWLRARDYDIKKAEKMLREHMAWRKQLNVDDLLATFQPQEVMTRYYTIGMPGYDKEGCPIWLVPFGNCDIKGLLHSVKKSEYIRHTVYYLEKSISEMKNQSERLGRHVGRHYAIFDLENFGMKHITFKPCMELITSLVSMHEANYPELLKRAIIINAPKVFQIAYAVIRPLLAEVTVSKIRIFGHDKWKEFLLQDIDASQLPVHYGGTLTDGSGDPRCPTLVCVGGDVPQSYYMAPANRLSDLPGLQMATVRKGTTLWLEKEVTQPESVLKWAFQTEEFDIAFGVYMKTNKGQEEVIPKERVNSHLVPEDGEIYCKQPGVYKICFDNSYSFLRNKKLMYVLNVVSPENTDQHHSVINGKNCLPSMEANPPNAVIGKGRY